MARRKYKHFNKYAVMWVFVLFDLPVKTKTEIRKATRFRNDLLELGFQMKQFSVYLRHCASLEKAEQLSLKIQKLVPEKGYVSVLFVTDRQYALAKNFFGVKKQKNEEKKRQEQGNLLLL